jgi:hypothetical protein
MQWWSRNRPAFRDSLANEVDRAPALIDHVPKADVARRASSSVMSAVCFFAGAGNHLYYQVLDAQEAIYVVYFHHAHRRPISRP